jgi:hypothetical protein
MLDLEYPVRIVEGFRLPAEGTGVGIFTESPLPLMPPFRMGLAKE